MQFTPPKPASSPTPSPRRRFGLRFSLRAFLGGVTVFCILLAWQLHRARQQREAVAAIRDSGGWAYYDYQFADPASTAIDPKARPWEPQWFLNLVGIDFFHN